MPAGEDDTKWLERELAELRAREAHYRERLGRTDAEIARIHAHAEALHKLVRRKGAGNEELTRRLGDIARLSSQALRVARASVWLFEADQSQLVCKLQLVDGHEDSCSRLVLPCAPGSPYVAALSEGLALAVTDLAKDPRTAELSEYAKQNGLGALLDIPLMLSGQLVGVVCHEHAGEARTWSTREIDFAESAGHLVALMLETGRRMHAELHARSSSAKYQYLVESLPVTVYSFEARTGRLDYLSPQAVELGGRPVESWLGEGVKGWIDRINPEDRAPVLLRFQQGVQGGFPPEITYRVKHDDGRVRFVRDTCRVVRDHAGEPIAIQGVLADVTDEAEALRAREEAERRYRAVLENVDVIAVALDVKGRVTFANEAFAKISGFSRDELLGADWFELVLPPATRSVVRERFLADVARATVAPRFEIAIVTRAGDTRQLLSTNTLLRAVDGSTQGTISLALDMTERRRLENELLHHTKIESLGRLAAGVAHDFNNLLAVMLRQVSALREKLEREAPAATSASIDALDQAIKQARELTQALLVYGRKQPSDNDAFSIDELVGDTMPLLEALAGAKLKLSASLHASGARLLFDRARVRQVLLNLVGNAADATAGHGTGLRVSTHIELLEESVARARGAAVGGEFVVLSVADDGPGLDARALSRIFDPFFTTKGDGRGTGLGLAIVQAVASQAGGFVEVESRPGAGATFRVFFPTRARRVSTIEAAPSAAAKVTSARRVLVVEDIASIRDFIATVLGDAGYEPVAVADTRAAADALGSSAFDLLITDLNLPDGSGSVLARSARSARPELRVLLMSGSLDFDDSFDGALPKPFDARQLLSAVASALANEG